MFPFPAPIIIRSGTVGSAWDAAFKASSISLSNSNKTATKSTGNTYKGVRGEKSVSSGKYGFEITINASNNQNDYLGLCDPNESVEGPSGGTTNNLALYPGGYYVGVDGGEQLNGYASGDVVGLFLDRTSNTLSFYKNGTLLFTRKTNALAFYPFACLYGSGSTFIINTGPLAYTVSGFSAWG